MQLDYGNICGLINYFHTLNDLQRGINLPIQRQHKITVRCGP